jgi:hypothetical protein
MQPSRQRDLESGWPDPEGKYPMAPVHGVKSAAAAHASLVGKPPAAPAAVAPTPPPVMQVGTIRGLSEEAWPDDTAPAGAQDQAAEDAAPAPLTDEQELEELDAAIKASEARRALLRERLQDRAMVARLQGG